MEHKFKVFMDEEESASFVSFSRSLGDLADFFRVKKKEKTR